MAGLLVPLAQQVINFSEIEPLSGAYNLPEVVNLKSETWFSGEFQQKYSPYYEYKIGFRSSLVRLRNQLYYWAYGESTNYVVIGKENQLYAWNYWAPFGGLDLVPDSVVESNVNNLKLLEAKLNEMGVPLLVVIGANKARLSISHMPSNYKEGETLPNNYRNYISAMSKANLPVVDFNAVFKDLKKDHGLKLFPNTGTHWSGLGMSLCLDSILAFANRKNADDLAQARVMGSFLADSTLESDVDLSNDLNLIYPLKTERNLFANTQLTSGRKANLFVIGDSFYWNLYQLNDFYATVDSSSHYWYYNNTDIDFISTREAVENFDPVKLASKADAVVIVATEANLHLFPFGFPEEFLENF